jgi:phenylalanyl-tRNA synthetase beta chain
MGKKLLGVMGELHPNVLKELGVKNAACLELDLAELLEMKSSPIKASIPSSFPKVERDLALLIDKEISYEQVERYVKKASSLIKKVDLFDIYEGSQIKEGFKSVAYSISFRANDRTLEDKDITPVMEKILADLSNLGVELRA